MCNHPQSNWVGTADGIRCGLCGALVGAPAPEPVKVEAPKPEPILDPEPEEKPEPKKAPAKKPVPKKGGTRGKS